MSRSFACISCAFSAPICPAATYASMLLATMFFSSCSRSLLYSRSLSYMPARYRFFASITCSLYLNWISAICACNSFSCFFLRSASALASAFSLAICALVLAVLPLAAGVVPLFPFVGSLLVAPPSRFASFR